MEMVILTTTSVSNRVNPPVAITWYHINRTNPYPWDKVTINTENWDQLKEIIDTELLRKDLEGKNTKETATALDT